MSNPKYDLFNIETHTVEVWRCKTHGRVDCPACGEVFVKLRTDEAMRQIVEHRERQKVN